MTRGLGIVSLVVSLVISLMLFSSQLTPGGSKPASPKENPIVQQASSVAAEAAAVQAERACRHKADRGTFVGATVTDIAGVTVLHASRPRSAADRLGRRRSLRRRARRDASPRRCKTTTGRTRSQLDRLSRA
jgi:hypothetical protein